MSVAKYVPQDDMYPSNGAGYSGSEPPKMYNDWKMDFTVPDSMKSTWDKNKAHIMGAAKATGVDPALILSHMYTESRGDPGAVSEAGAIGTMQVMPSTGAELGFTTDQLKDPQMGTLAGAMYIQKMHNQFGGNLVHATSAYFDGPGNVGKSLELTGDVRKGKGNVDYLGKVLGGYGMMRELPDDYSMFSFPFSDGKVRSSGGNMSLSDPETRSVKLHTPSELSALQDGLSEGTLKRLGIQAEEMTGMRMRPGWYGAMERAAKAEGGNHAVVPDDMVWPKLMEEAEREEGSTFSDLGKAFMHGMTTSVTSMGIAAGALGSKMGLGEALLDKSLAATAALDRYYELSNPRFLTTLASGFGSTLPLFLGGGIGTGIAKGMLRTVAGKAIAARMANAMARGGAVTTLMQRIGAKGVAFNIGMSVPEAAMEAGGAFNQALNEGMTEDEAYAAAQKTFLGNAALLPVTNVPYTIPGIKPWVKMLAGGMVEGIQENWQENISEAALQKRDWSDVWKPDQGEAIAVGFIIGSIMHGVKMGAEGEFKGKEGEKDQADVADRVAILMGVARAKGAVDPTTSEEIARATEFAREIAFMPDSDLNTAADAASKRLDELDSALAGEIETTDGEVLGTKEELEAERARVGLEFTIAWREYMVREVQRRFEKGNTTPAELEQLIKNVTERNKKRGGVTDNEMEQSLVAVQVLARTGELKEATLKTFTDAFPVFRPALEVMRETEKAAKAAPDESGPGAEGAPVETPAASSPPKAAGTPGAPQTKFEDQVKVAREMMGDDGDVTLADLASKLDIHTRDAKEVYLAARDERRALGEPAEKQKGGRKSYRIIKEEDIDPETAASAAPVKAIADKMGLKVLWSNDINGIGGYSRGLKTIFINPQQLKDNPSYAVELVIGHEIGHHIFQHKELRGVMRDLLRNVESGSEQVQAAVDAKRKSYNIDKLTEEAVADLLALELINPSNEQLLQKHLDPNTLQKVINTMVTFIEDLKLRVGENGDIVQILEERLKQLTARMEEIAKSPAKFKVAPKGEKTMSQERAQIGVKKGFVSQEDLDATEKYASFTGQTVYLQKDVVALMEKGGRAGEAKLSDLRVPRKEARSEQKAARAEKKATTADRAKAVARKLRASNKKKREAARARVLAKADKSTVKRAGLTGTGQEALKRADQPLKLTEPVTDLESRGRVIEQIQDTENRIEQIKEAIASGTLGKRFFSFVKKDKSGKPMIRLNHAGYARWEVTYTDSSGREVTEEVTNKKKAEGLRDRLVTAQTNDLINAKRALAGRQQDLTELKGAVSEFDRTGVPGETPVSELEAQRTEAQEVLESEVAAVEGAPDIETEDVSLASKLKGQKEKYAYGDGVELSETNQENEAADRELSWINEEDTLKLINSMNRVNKTNVPLTVLTDGTVKSKRTMFETVKYSLGDLIDLFGSRTAPSMDESLAIAVAELGEVRMRIEDEIDGAIAREADVLHRQRLARNYLEEAGDYGWLFSLDERTGVTVDDRMEDGSKPSPGVVEARIKMLDARNRILGAMEARETAESRLKAVDTAYVSPLARINSLLAQLERLRKTVDYGYKRGHHDSVQDALDKIAEINFQLESMNVRNTTWNEFNPLNTVAEVGRFAGDILTGNYATGRVEGTKVKEISKNPDVQKKFTEQNTAREIEDKPDTSPRRKVNEAYRDGFDNLHMTKVAMEDNIGGPDSAKAMSLRGVNHYVNMRGIARGWARAARWFLEQEVVSFMTGKVLYKNGLKKILKKNGIAGDQAKYERLGLYMLAKRIVYLADPVLGNPKRFSGTEAEIREYQEGWKSVYEDLSRDKDLVNAAEELSQFNKALVEFMNEMGVFKDGEFNNIVNDPFYAPLYNIDKDTSAAGISSDINRDANKGVKTLGTIDKNTRFMHPVEAISANTVRYTNIGYINYVKSRLGELVDMVGEETFGYHIDLDPSSLSQRTDPRLSNQTEEQLEYRKQAEVKLKQAVDGAIIYYGIPKAQQDEIKQAILSADPSMNDDPQMQQIKAWVANAELADDMVAYLDNGELRIMKLNKDLMDGFATLKTENIGKVMNVARKLTNALKTGATLTPDFASRNMIRDFLGNVVGAGRMITDPSSAASFVHNWFRSFNSIFSNDENFRGFVMGGGALSEFISLGRDEMKNMVNSLRRQANPKEVFLHPGTAFPVMLDMIKNVSALSETVTRLAVYRTRLGQLEKQSPGTPSYITNQLAAFDSREAGIDFARVGQQMRVLNHLQPFFTASLGGTDKMVRSMFSPQADRAGTWVRGFLAVTVPSLALYALNKDEEWYKARPSWEKNLFWMTKVGGVIVRIPKPFEYGLIFGSVPERMVEYAEERDPHEVKKLLEMILTQTYGGALDAGGWLTSIVPPVSALYHAKSNYDPFRGEKIVKGVREELEAPYQYSNSTKEFSKWISNALYRGADMKVSPAKIDFWVRSSFAGLGTYALDLLSAPWTITAEDSDLVPWYSRAPVIKGFVRKDPAAFGRWSDEFYDMLEASRRAVKTRNYLLKSQRDVSSMTYELGRNGKFAAIYPAMNNISQMAKKITIAVEAIKYDDTLSSSQKRERIDRLYRTREELYRKGVAMAFKVMPEADKISKDAARRLEKKRRR